MGGEGNDPAGAITYWGDQIRHTLPHLYVDDFQLSGIVRLGTENGRHGLQLVGSIVNLCRASELTVGKLLAQLPKSETAGLGNSSDLGSANSANIFALFPDGVPEDERLVMLEVKLQTNSARPKEEQVSKRQIARELTGETKDSWKRARSLLSQLNRIHRRNHDKS